MSDIISTGLCEMRAACEKSLFFFFLYFPWARCRFKTNIPHMISARDGGMKHKYAPNLMRENLIKSTLS